MFGCCITIIAFLPRVRDTSYREGSICSEMVGVTERAGWVARTNVGEDGEDNTTQRLRGTGVASRERGW